MDPKQKSDHELLIDVLVIQGKHSVRFDSLDKQFSNHLQHHWSITMLALSAALTGLASFVVGLFMVLLRL